MNNGRKLLIGAALVTIALVGWYGWRHGEAGFASRGPAISAAAQAKIENPNSKNLSADDEAVASHLADDLNAPGKDIRSDLRVVSDVLDAFRTNFPHAGNPVGDNVDITAALTGKNKLRLALIPRDHPAINAAGELCDRWGTPFFFHAESGTRMGIRSAGPDRKMWTADDVVLDP
jgi:hypothetical protein